MYNKFHFDFDMLYSKVVLKAYKKEGLAVSWNEPFIEEAKISDGKQMLVI